jgi:predicted molibdopterin-dependent oxidoreductase YjgC
MAGVYPSMSHPANKGKICIRGWHVHEVTSSPDRLKKPLLKSKYGQFEEVTWEEAFAFIASRLKEIKASYGPDSIAFLNSPRCSNEESYLLQKLARAVIGTNNVDHGAGVYTNNSINVLLDTIGVPATTGSLEDLDHSEVIVVDGVDLARQLPTVGGRVIRAKLAGAKLIVIGERRQRVAENADWFLQIIPGTETLLYGAMAKVIVDHALMDLPFIKAHCDDYEAFLAKVSEYDLLAAAEGCGVSAEMIEAVALAYARAKSAAILYSTGAETRDADTAKAIVNLALLTGQIGKRGAGIFALTEHNNLQGVCDVGMLPDWLPGYRPAGNAMARAEVEAIWGCKLPNTPGVSGSAVLKDRAEGKIKALWITRYDPVNTAAVGTAPKVLEECELVIAQHLFMTETAKYADVVLPTASFGEERVTFTSTERRIQIAERVVDPAPGVTSAWQQVAKVAQALGADWKYETAADVMAEIGTVVPFYSGASYDNLALEYGRQWPCTKDQPLGTPTLFEKEDHGDRFRFAPVRKPAPVAVNKDFPFTLVVGNSSYYWNQNVLIAHSETLKREYRMLLLDYPRGFVEINPDDAKTMKIRDGQTVKLCAAGGFTLTAVRVTPEVRSGTVFVPYQEVSKMEQVRGFFTSISESPDFYGQEEKKMEKIPGAQGDVPRFLAVRIETEVA